MVLEHDEIDELAHWITTDELKTIPNDVMLKINTMICNYRTTVASLQTEQAFTTSMHQAVVEDLKKRLKDENQRYLEMEMNCLKYKTENNKREYSKGGSMIRKRLALLSRKNRELKQTEQSLNAQIEFLIGNADKSVQELCEIASMHLKENVLMKSKLEKCDTENVEALKKTVEKLKEDVAIFKRNEEEYQAFVYSKALEIHKLSAECQDLKVKNGILEQYRIKYENTHEEYLKVCASLDESRQNNRMMNEQLLEELKALLVDGKGFVKLTGIDFGTIKKAIYTIKKSKDKLETFVSELIQKLEDEKQASALEEDPDLNELRRLKEENETLKKIQGTPTTDNEAILKQNKMLMNDIENLRDELARQSKDGVDLSYINNLEAQLDRYKKDVKLIEEQFTQYKKIYESFNIEETTKKMNLMRENIEKKDVLIGQLGCLIGRYRELKTRLEQRMR